MIKCTQCGFDNPPERLYCVSCKAKLNLSQITKESFTSPEKRGNYYRAILSGILIIIAIVVLLALWPAQSDPGTISAAEFGKTRNKLNTLQTGAATAPVEFSDREVSILFNHLIQEIRRRPDFKAGFLSIYTSKVVINPTTLTIYLNYQIGPWKLGPVTIGPFQATYKVTGRPEKRADGLRFAVLNGTVGHLPLPAVGGNFGTTQLQNIFFSYKNARVFLSGLEIVEMKEGSVTVSGAK